MTAQPIEQPNDDGTSSHLLVDRVTGVVTPMTPKEMRPLLPRFDGHPVSNSKLTFTVSGLESADGRGDIPVHFGDTVRLVVEARCIGVNHVENKDGQIERVQKLRVIDASYEPWDPTDPNDEGILRAHP